MLDGKQVWMTLKDSGKMMVFDAKPPFSILKTIDTGPITNHVNVVHNQNGQFAYVTVGSEGIRRPGVSVERDDSNRRTRAEDSNRWLSREV